MSAVAVRRATDAEERRLRAELAEAERYFRTYPGHDAEIIYLRAQHALDTYLEETNDG